MTTPIRVLALGGSGFLGSFFAECARDQDHAVTVFGRNPGRHFGADDGIRLVTGDLADFDQVCSELEQHDVVYYFPWDGNPAKSWEHPVEEVQDSVRNSVQVFELAAKAGVKKTVFCSSGGTVYGSSPENVTENHPPEPSGPYGIGKLTAEYFLRYTCKRFGMAGDVYRISNLYGPRQPIDRRQGVIGIWMDHLLRGQAIDVFGTGATLRDYVYVKDAAMLMTHSLCNPAHSDTYNLGSGQGVSILDLLKIFQTELDVDIQTRMHPQRPFDVDRIVLDSSKLVAHFPEFSFRALPEAIKETWNALAS